MPDAYPRQAPVPRGLARVHRTIITCERCPRLRAYCRGIAETRRAAYRDETYWARPVPGFGDAAARLLIVGLAPAAHGANRTGRVFTGDGVNASGDFLMRAMHAAGFASQTVSHRTDDGLVLHDAYIAAAVRCAPPDNKPTPLEVATCLAHLDAERRALPNLRLVIVLGRIAFDAWRQLLARDGVRLDGRHFAHGHVVPAPNAGLPPVLQSYHPSRQNTHTGRLTDRMLADVFHAARAILDASHP
jgi:uracil-DNA glycosylase family 4